MLSVCIYKKYKRVFVMYTVLLERRKTFDNFIKRSRRRGDAKENVGAICGSFLFLQENISVNFDVLFWQPWNENTYTM